MNRKRIVVVALAVSSLVGSFAAGEWHGRAAARASFDVMKTAEYHACIATIVRAGLRNTDLRRQLESK